MKASKSVLFGITLAFLVFCAGYLLGKQKSGDEIHIALSKTETTAAEQQTESTAVTALKINLNTAGLDELCMLPNIGEVIAQRILDYREEHGDFTCLEDLDQVEGIGSARIEEIRDYVTVEGSHEDTGS